MPAPSPTRASPRSEPAPRWRWPSTGIVADIVPEHFVAEELVEALNRLALEGKPVLVARAAEARELLPTPFASGERRWTSSPSTRRSPNPPRPRRSIGSRRRTSSPSPPPRPCGTSSRRSTAASTAGPMSIGPINERGDPQSSLEVELPRPSVRHRSLVEALLGAAARRLIGYRRTATMGITFLRPTATERQIRRRARRDLVGPGVPSTLSHRDQRRDVRRVRLALLVNALPSSSPGVAHLVVDLGVIGAATRWPWRRRG